MSNRKGFTLTEIVVAVIIVGILASLSIPRMNNTFERFRAAEGVEIITALLHAQKAYFQEVGSYTADLNNLDITIDNPRYFTASVSNATPNIAMATRVGGQYQLNMSNIGVISCTNLGGAGFTCGQAGY
jgi:prepilin-type N-terminal cleavage/methylation domain-containing protein